MDDFLSKVVLKYRSVLLQRFFFFSFWGEGKKMTVHDNLSGIELMDIDFEEGALFNNRRQSRAQRAAKQHEIHRQIDKTIANRLI